MNKNNHLSDEIQPVHLPKNAQERYAIGPAYDQYRPSRKGLFVRLELAGMLEGEGDGG